MIFSIQLNALLLRWVLYSPTAWKGSTARGSDAAAFITEGGDGGQESWVDRQPRRGDQAVLCHLIFIWFFKSYDNSNFEQYLSWQGENRDSYFLNCITYIAKYEGHIWNHNLAWSCFLLQVNISSARNSSHGTRTCIKRKKINYGKFFNFCAEKCVYN